MKKILLIPAILILIGCAGTESITYNTSTDELLTFGNSIDTSFLMQHLEVIAHDSLEGRGTGTAGLDKTADYIAHFYSGLELTPKGDDSGWFQYFNLNATITDSLVYSTYRIEGADTLLVNHTVEAYDSFSDYYRTFGGSIPVSEEIVFVGFGINDESRNVQHLESDEISGKWVMMFEDMPYIVEGDTLINPQISANDRLRYLLRDHNVSGILMITDKSETEFNELASLHGRMLGNPENLSLEYRDDLRAGSGFPIGFMNVSPRLAAEILGLNGPAEIEQKREQTIQNITSFRPQSTGYLLDYKPYMHSGTIETQNILAYLEGADPELKEEVLVLMAHYDHVGIGQPDSSGDMIYNGADDNGSGTVALMAIANALSNARSQGFKPKRSILFLHVSAEEVGLLGSRYYSDHPVIPIEKTVANFNADMIGRSDPQNIESGDTDYVYLIGGEIISSGLDSLVTAANQQSVNMRLDRRYNDLSDPNQFYRRSDHWNFGRLSVPFVFFFTGVHEDYHQPSDTFDKIEFDKYRRVVQLIYSSSIMVSNYDGRPVVDNQEFIDITGSMPR